jgi:hypothetical protein
MASTSLAFGVVLIVFGLASYFLTGMVSVTALIPAFFGFVLALLGLVARDENKRKHAMHGAVLVALLGFGGAVPGLLKIGSYFDGTAARPAAVMAQSIMAVLMLIYLVMAIRSFAAARAARREAGRHRERSLRVQVRHLFRNKFRTRATSNASAGFAGSSMSFPAVVSDPPILMFVVHEKEAE